MGIFDTQTKGGGWEVIPLSESQKIADQIRMELMRSSGEEVFEPREIAKLTDLEKMAVNMVKKWMSGGLAEVKEAINAVRGFMNADLTPKNIPGLSGLFKKAEELGASLLSKKKRGLAYTGNLPSESSAGTKTLGRVWQDILDSFITSAYPFYQPFISAKLSAPERLANLATSDITSRTGAAATVGSLQRQIQQQIKDAIFEAKRKTQEYPYQVTFPMTSSVMGEQRYMWDPGVTSPSVFSQITSAIPPIVMGGSMLSGMGGGSTSTGGWDDYIMNKYGF